MKRKLSLLLPFLAIASLLPSFESSASSGKANPRVVRYQVKESPRDVIRYWTKDRMQAAKPAPIHLPDPNLSDEPVERGEPHAVAPSSPEESIALTMGRKMIAGHRQGIPDPNFTRDEIVNVTDFPYVTHGKLFFRSGGGSYVCSATVISSPNQNTVVTAGHCIYDVELGAFSTRVMFSPGYRNGNEPFDRWAADEIFTTQEWMQEGDNRYDFAAFTTTPNENGDVEEAVGGRGIIFNQEPLGNEYEIFGYPAADPFDGEKLWRCQTGPNFNDFVNDVDSIIGVGCDLTGGSSGGGWMTEVDGVKYLNSVMSYGYDEPFLEYSFGPYLGTEAEAVFAEATGAEPPTPDPDPTDPPDEGGEHELGLDLNLRRHLRVSGDLFPLDNFEGCFEYTTVGIYRLIPGTNSGAFVKELYTDGSGHYSGRIRDRAGRYFADASPFNFDENNVCLQAQSRLVRHRH